MTLTEHAVPAEELMAYVDGELSPAQAAAIEAHLAGCRACQKTIADLRQVSHDLARWSVDTPAAKPAPHIHKHGVSWMRRLASVPIAPVAQFAAIGIVLIGGTVIWFDRAQQAPRPLVRQAAESAPLDSGAGGGGGGPRLGQSTALEGRAAESQTPGGRSAREESVGQARSSAAVVSETPAGSNVIRTASLTIVTKTFDQVRPAIEQLVREASGFVGHIQASGGRGAARTLTATLRVPSNRLDATLAALRALGQVTDDTQGGEDVTTQMIDLDARLKNSRNTENRLTDILQRRTGDVGDVLEVEREIARVRGEIEQLDAQRKQLHDRVAYATISLNVSEEREAKIDTGTLTIGAQLRNAFVDGMQAVYATAAGVLLTILRVGPVLAFWALVLWWPIRRATRAIR